MLVETQIYIAIVNGVGFVIGKATEGQLMNPRIMVVGNNGKNELTISFRKFLGDPGIFEIGASPYYSSEDNEINAAYVEEVTGLVVTKLMPRHTIQ
jgi:hypothetical protein